MPTLDDLPLRNSPSGLAVPPARMALLRDRRPLKRWRYLGLYGEELMLCAANVRVGGAAPGVLGDVGPDGAAREDGLPAGRGRAGRRRARGSGRPRLVLEPDGEPMEVTSRHGDSYIWTRKQPVRATGTVDGRPVTLRGLIDDSAGYHARRTDWRWCAGVGETPAGNALAFNIVVGVHDAAVGSERTLWVDGVAQELAPATFDEDLRDRRVRRRPRS